MSIYPFLIVWVCYAILSTYNMFVLASLRRRGVLPPRSLAFQVAFLSGKFDHLPELRRIRRLARVLLVTAFLTLIGSIIRALAE
jgi:hypothetical protein